MIRACIDIGTNSVKLLVASVEDRRIVDVLLYQTATTRIGQGIDRTHKLPLEAIDRTVEAIEVFRQEAERLGASEIIPVATSAVRDAQNQDVFIQKVIAQTGLKPQVISGAEEARLTFVGVCSSKPELRSEKLVIVDVGGGSSDFVVAGNGEIQDAFSVKAGFIRLTEAFLHSDPVTPDELQNAMDHIVNLIHDRFARVSMDERHLVGGGGTINILMAILYQRIGQYLPEGAQMQTLQRNEVNALLRYLSRMKQNDRRQVPGLPPNRADVIVAGAAIFSAIMKILNAKEIIVSDRGMRYGVLLSCYSV
ncbi:hypothetical protein ACFL6S_04880 [Candidatus Poribacteria bacterium]